MTTPKECLAQGIEGVGIDPAVARAIAEVTVMNMRCEEHARLLHRHHEVSHHSRCWAMLFMVVRKLAPAGSDWNVWGRAHCQAWRLVRAQKAAQVAAEREDEARCSAHLQLI
jgi:N6-adenosine-specific RNA methylase IME4